jgi:hypothetical protein
MPWMAYVEGHHDVFALAQTAEAEIRAAFPHHLTEVNDCLDEAGGAALAHFWLIRTQDAGEVQCFEIASAEDTGAFPVTGVRFHI